MRFRIACALAVALALPVWAQHQAGGHGGFSGHSGGSGRGAAPARAGNGGQRGFSGHAGSPSYSSLVGIQQPSSFAPPGRFPMPGRLQPPVRSGVPLSDRGQGFSAGRYPYRPGYPGRHPHRNPYRGHDRDRGHGRWAGGYAYPYVYSYPYIADPGFYDWGATDYSENEANSDVAPEEQPEYGYQGQPSYPEPGDVPYPQQQGNAAPSSANAPPQRQEYHFAAASPSPMTSKPLTVIFKDNRAPETIQNYMVNSTSLTNLDKDQFERIPLDQIDVAATQEANRSHGIDFQVPVASRD